MVNSAVPGQSEKDLGATYFDEMKNECMDLGVLTNKNYPCGSNQEHIFVRQNYQLSKIKRNPSIFYLIFCCWRVRVKINICLYILCYYINVPPHNMYFVYV